MADKQVLYRSALFELNLKFCHDKYCKEIYLGMRGSRFGDVRILVINIYKFCSMMLKLCYVKNVFLLGLL